MNELNSIFNLLDINHDNGLATNDNPTMGLYQKQIFQNIKEKLNIDAVYFLRDSNGDARVPLIYFSALNQYDAIKISEIHRLAWNLGEAPLLFIVLPDRLLIFNNYSSSLKKDGSFDINKALIDEISLLNDLEKQRQLQQYSRLQLETGNFWKINDSRFNIKERVDYTLLSNLKTMRKVLIKDIQAKNQNIDASTIVSVVHCFLGRSILIKYLEERKDSMGNTVFPKNFYSNLLKDAEKYTDVLSDKNATYMLFQQLDEHFHGDIFPILEKEKELISEDELKQLKLFLEGETHLESGQMCFWKLYSFNVIPIQLISNIYELFFHLTNNEDDEKGTYYTPYHLVEMLTDEVLPWDGNYKEVKVLDPSCGSGIFLVEAYRRLVGKWMHTNNTTQIDSKVLKQIMCDCIFGVDCNGEAIRIASFSLCLAMCDYLEPRCIWQELEFPNLKNTNLFVNDFFDNNDCFSQKKYDIVIGNPPWESALSHAAKQYIYDRKYPIGDKQIAQVFSWKAAELCKDTGFVCLLMPSKGFLFNQSNTNAQYRKKFFDTNAVRIIVNFSAYSYILFEHAKFPAVGVIYSPVKERVYDLFYCTPKPLYNIEDRRRFLIESNDICKIPQELIAEKNIWKTAMWGQPRDLEFISKLENSFQNLEEFMRLYNLTHAEGFKRGNRKDSCQALLNKPMIFPKDVVAYTFPSDRLSIEQEDGFERTVKSKTDVFLAPHLIIKQSPAKWQILSAFLEYDAVFNHSILGIHGNEQILKYLCLLINSKVFSYYQIMTSRRWLVERYELEKADIMNAPIPSCNTAILEESVRLFERLVCNIISQSEVDNFIYSLYNIKNYEIFLIEDAIDYVYDFCHKKKKSKSLSVPSKNLFDIYKSTLCEIIKNSLNLNEVGCLTLFSESSPLSVAIIDFESTDIEKNKVYLNLSVEKILYELDALLVSKRSNNVYVRRNARIYNKNLLYIIKPNQQKYWNYSAACRDADEVFTEIMKAWRETNE